VTRLWRAVVSRRDTNALAPGGARVLPAYAALARYHNTAPISIRAFICS